MVNQPRSLLPRRSVHRVAGAVMLFMATLGTGGCGSMMVNATEAQVRFVDTSVDAPPLDVYLNGTGAAYNLGFATFSSYVPVNAGSYQFSANRANTGQALATGHAALVSGHQYTAVVGSRVGSLQEHVYADAVALPVAGTLAVRVLNEVEGAALDVYLVPNAAALQGAPAVASNVAFGANTGYARVPAGTSYAIYVIAAGSSPGAGGAVKVGGATISGASGAARTLILTEAAKEGHGVYGVVLEDGEAS